MGSYSNLDGTKPVTPFSDGVWSIRKKQKIADQDRRKNKENRKEKGDKEKEKITVSWENNNKKPNPDSDEQLIYGSEGKKRRSRRKIDVTI